ncbi:di-heme cytochrome c peroxidase [Gluconobacter oxydans NBRC 3293]|uniref:Di-heme cytochrome c peroxidase n=2 Tax=Gluconobacter oxydans TaxID=442 RepID=A0A829WTJ3_GLUOY|nr:di-heme cytochrome c peroxidase [Gluconobacter oxydans NBRC 3293]
MMRTIQCVSALLGMTVLGAGCEAQSSPASPPVSQDVCDPAPDGRNLCPQTFHRPRQEPLSQMAQIGRMLFYDRALSGSGKLSCASCHDPANHYGPTGDASVFEGGADLHRQGRRAIPTLTYLERMPPFSIGPDLGNDDVAPRVIAVPNTGNQRGSKSAADTASSAAHIVPQGGFFWDGRADTFQQQAGGPLFDPDEMASTPERVTARLNTAPYRAALLALAGARGEKDPAFLREEALFAIGRYELEDRHFHEYSSRFDAWLEGKARFTPLEREGYLLFNDPQKGNCAACHLDHITRDGLPPLFTDHQYEALGAPRNMAISRNAVASYYDLGVCDAQSDGRKAFAAYCGMFVTPTLRNVATRRVFFHNGVFHTLEAVLDFYAVRDLQPEKFYPRRPDGKINVYNDVPEQYRSNIDTIDAPFDRRSAEAPALSENERRAIIAFLGTLTDTDAPAVTPPVDTVTGQTGKRQDG